MTESHVEAQIKARIAAARRRTEDMRRQRAELAAARRRGLAARHAQKLRNLRGAEDHAGVTETDTTVGQRPIADPSRRDTPTAGVPDHVGDHVIVPAPWCSCGGALGVAPGRVTGFEPNGDPVVQLDLSGCSTRPTAPHCFVPPLVFTRREIEELRWLL